MSKIWLSLAHMGGSEQKFVREAFETNWVVPLGPNVDGFEHDLSEWLSTHCNQEVHAVALSSGTAAIHLALIMLGVSKGDEVICQSFTFAASANPICYQGATPIFVDSEPDTWNMDPVALEKAFEKYPHPAAVIAVHLYGTPSKIDRIRDICKKHQVPLIEDAAEALGSSFKGQKLGTFGDYGILSFNGNKIITSSGGGMLLCSDEAKIKRARFLATQARDPARYYQHSTIGYNYRMSNVVAGIGRGQLLHLEEHKARKNEIYRQYKEAFADIEAITMNPMNPDGDANNWLSCMTIAPDCSVTPDQVMDALAEYNIETRPIWKPMHLQPVFADCDFIQVKEGRSVSEDIFNRGVCLPSDIKNTPEDMKLIISLIRKVFEK